VTEAT